MDQVLGLKCVLCGAEYGVDEVRYVCPKHGDEGILDVVYDYDRIRKRLTAQTLAADPNADDLALQAAAAGALDQPAAAADGGLDAALPGGAAARAAGAAPPVGQGRRPAADRVVQGPGQRGGDRQGDRGGQRGDLRRLQRQRRLVAGRAVRPVSGCQT